MAKVESCHSCVYARWDLALWARTLNSVFPARPVCGNHPDFPGRMKECPLGRVCRNFRAKPPTPTGETVKTISLGGGLVAYVDAADFEWLNQWTWHLGCGGYAYRLEKTKVILMHRQIMRSPKGLVVHHKNRNRLDNTRENMENTTAAKNALSRSKPRNTSSRFWGVSYIKDRAKYQVFVWYESKALSCGYFVDEIEAARAHDYKAVQLKGEAARLNFPDEWPPQRRAQVYATAEAKSARRKATQRKTPAAKPKTKSKRVTGHKTRLPRSPAAERTTHNARRNRNRQRMVRHRGHRGHRATSGRKQRQAVSRQAAKHAKEDDH